MGAVMMVPMQIEIVTEIEGYDGAVVAELEARQAHYAEPLAVEHVRVEFELRRGRGLYVIDEEAAEPA